MHEPTNQHWTLSDLCEALTGNLVALKGSTRQTFSSITTDSRTVAKGEVFVALVGEKFDGHDYALAAEKAGAGALVLNRSVGAACPELIVNDTAEAYGILEATSIAPLDCRCRLKRQNHDNADDGGDSFFLRRRRGVLHSREPK